MKILLLKIKLILLLFFVGSTSLFSQSASVKITPVNNLKNVIPGEHYTLVFDVSEETKTASTYTLKYQFPEEFKLLLAKKSINFAKKENQKLYITFAVSSNCPANNYQIAINVLKNNTNVTNYTSRLEVKKIFNLDIEPLKYPDYLRLEKEFTTSYSVSNTGNSKEEIRFYSTQSLAVNPEIATLKPNESVIVKVTQKVPHSPFTTTLALNLLKAELIANGKQFSSQIPITVYPNNKEKPNLYHRFPVSFSTIYNSVKGLDTLSALKYKVEGAGYLDSSNKHYLDFLFTGPDQAEMTRFGEYDQYSVHYRNDDLEVFAGDITYSLSYLTEMSRYGFGGLINYKIKDSYSRVFYLKPRFTDRIKEAYGADFTWKIAPKLNLKLGFINRILFEDKKEFESQIYSLSTLFNNKFLKLNGEIAYENNAYSSGYGFGVESYLNHKKYYWGNSIYYSDKNFKGYLRNSKQLASRFNYKFNHKINASAYVNYREINPVKDSINYNSSPIIENYQTNLNYKINRSNRLRFGVSYRKKED
ncbi:MAG TPA: hypothetical protein VJ970_07740, partial [Flavobacteriaceae bacterium]|nr:hypothetical protein [Flavobacteriaceae bacterium]